MIGKSTQQWANRPLNDLNLERKQIHIWRGRYPYDVVDAEILLSLLSKEEKSRAQKFARTDDRNNYIFAHSMLRQILACYSGIPPQKLTFTFNAYGKPFLLKTPNLSFSLTHSKDVVLVALGHAVSLGVDVELVRFIDDIDGIMKGNFTNKERAYIQTFASEQIQHAFFTHWTLKEAYIKGIGMGLSFPLMDVTILPDHSSTAIDCLFSAIPVKGNPFKCLFFSPFPGYIGALAVEKIHQQPMFLDFNLLDLITIPVQNVIN